MVVILDCNIWITLALNSQLDYINDLLDRELTIASCTELKNEVAGVIARPKFNKFFLEAQRIKIIEFHNLVTTIYNIGKIISVMSDPKDDYLFSLAMKSKADYLVTGDKLLLELPNYKTT